MGTLIQDMSRLTPAPTVRRETAVLVATTVFVLVVFGGLIAVTDKSPALYAALGAALLVFGIGRWLYTVKRGDVAHR